MIVSAVKAQYVFCEALTGFSNIGLINFTLAKLELHSTTSKGTLSAVKRFLF
jgi:hypothetical protein